VMHNELLVLRNLPCPAAKPNGMGNKPSPGTNKISPSTASHLSHD
jgi:hypothetical protein